MRAMEGFLRGDTALVTGAASGIGRGVATMLAREGARLVVADVDCAARGMVAACDAERAATVAADTRRTGATVDFVASALSRPDAASQLFEAAQRKLGRISVLVHCASPYRRETDTALTVTPEIWDQMTSVNLRSGFFLGQSIGRHM